MKALQDWKSRLKYDLTIRAMRRSSLFDEAWYRANSPTPPREDEDALLHYYNGGWRTCDPSEAFRHKDYWRTSPDVQEKQLCPLAHYVTYGRLERRKHTSEMVDISLTGKYRPLRLLRSVRRAYGRLACAPLIRKNRQARILVCLQMFYPHSWPEIEQYLKNLRPYQVDLVVTYQDFGGFEKMLRDIRRLYPNAITMEVNNIGFDIGGFHKSLQGIDLSRYDIIFKLHSKGVIRPSIHIYHQLFFYRDWFLFLFEGVLGARNAHLAVDALLNDPTCGMVAAENLLVHDPKHKQHIVQKKLAEYAPEVQIPKNYAFVSGTCFAVRADLMKPFADRAVVFAESKRRIFSTAHCEERAMCFPAQLNGYHVKGLTARPRRLAYLRKQEKLRYGTSLTEQLLADDRFDLDDEYAVTGIESRRVEEYELAPLRLGDIRRRWFDGEIYTLKECAPYRYLCGDESAYEEYSRYHLERDLPLMTRERFQALVDSIDRNGYDARKVIVVDYNNILLDGQHRACVLLKKFGEDYTPTVLRIRF